MSGFAVTSPELRQLLEACKSRPLTPWEQEFVDSIQGRRSAPTEKQMIVLRRIAAGTPNYEVISSAALRALPEILSRWLPGGECIGHEYIVRNPKRGDRTPGSFSVNTRTCRWADFASNDAGGDAISLAAWLFDLPQPEAARRVAAMLGMSTEVPNG